MLVALPGGHKADLVADALAAKITTLPAALTRTLTWDQGHEMAQHVRFTQATGVEVYFCDPKSPWQRGSNENTNGLLRQYLPRTLDFRTLTQADFDAIADQLNGRPRQTLGFKTPSQALAVVLRCPPEPARCPVHSHAHERWVAPARSIPDVASAGRV